MKVFDFNGSNWTIDRKSSLTKPLTNSLQGSDGKPTQKRTAVSFCRLFLQMTNNFPIFNISFSDTTIPFGTRTHTDFSHFFVTRILNAQEKNFEKTTTSVLHSFVTGFFRRSRPGCHTLKDPYGLIGFMTSLSAHADGVRTQKTTRFFIEISAIVLGYLCSVINKL